MPKGGDNKEIPVVKEEETNDARRLLEIGEAGVEMARSPKEPKIIGIAAARIANAALIGISSVDFKDFQFE